MSFMKSRRLLASWADRATQWMLDLLEAWFPGPIDDLMGVVWATAEAPLGVVREDARVYDLCAAWSTAAAWESPTAVVLIDHTRCVGDDCTRTICDCPSEVPCRRTVSAGCGHGLTPLCDECRPNCAECPDDQAYDTGRGW